VWIDMATLEQDRRSTHDPLCYLVISSTCSRATTKATVVGTQHKI